MALKPASKRVTITDESVNSYKFCTLTAGIDIGLYTENPILLWMHKRADEQLPIGVMQDVKLETNGSYTGLPAFDDTDPFAMQLYNKYESGMLNMVSAGLEPVEVQGDGNFLKGKAPCLSKSIMTEVSLVDIGANSKAHKVKLYSKGRPLELSSAKDLIKLFNDNSDTMIVIPKSITELLKLSETATESEILTALKNNNAEIVRLTTELGTSKTAHENLLKEVNGNKIIALVDTAIKEKKITPAQKEQYITLATSNYDVVKGILDATASHLTLAEQLDNKNDQAANASELAELLKLSASQLFTTDKMERLKELSLPSFKIKYKEYTGVDFTEAKL